MSHLRRLIQQNLVAQTKRRFGGAAHHAPAAPATPAAAEAESKMTGGFSKDGEVLFRDWQGNKVVGKVEDYAIFKLKSEEDRVLFDIFKREFFKGHPTDAMDKSAFLRFTQDELAAINAVPKYSRPHLGLFGNRCKPRSVWLFPLYFTAGIVIHTNLLEHYDPEYYTLPLRIVFPKGEEH